MRVEAPVLNAPREPMRMREVIVDEPRRGQVRVRVAASGVCHSCLHAADGSHEGIPMPIILGDEGSGVVESVGPGVRGLQVGDHVVLSWTLHCGKCHYCVKGRPTLCNGTAPFGQIDTVGPHFRDAATGEPIYHYGPATYSPYVVVPESSAIRIRADIPLEQAALIGCSIPTGVGAVTNSAAARPGESVAIVGCGGVGINAVQGARLVGANPVIAIDVNDKKLEFSRKFGATHTINNASQGAAQALRDVLPDGADHVIVAVGSTKAIEYATGVVAPAGTLVLVGAPPSGEYVKLDPRIAMAMERKVINSRYGAHNPPIDFPKLADLCAIGRLDVPSMITHRYKLTEANEAFDALVRGEPGRFVITF